MADKSNLPSTLELIMNQTNYSKEIALEKLKQWDNNHMNVIREYLNPNFQKPKQKKQKSINQMVMSEIRNLMNEIQKNEDQQKLKLDSNN